MRLQFAEREAAQETRNTLPVVPPGSVLVLPSPNRSCLTPKDSSILGDYPLASALKSAHCRDFWARQVISHSEQPGAASSMDTARRPGDRSGPEMAADRTARRSSWRIPLEAGRLSCSG